MTVQLAPPIVFQSFLSNGAPNAFGTVAAYVAGTTTPQATYIDSTQTTQNQNPTPLNAAGQASIWLATNLVYKIIVFDAFGNQINFQDQVIGGISAAVIGQLIYPKSAAENTAGVTIVQGWYLWGTIDRYGVNTIPGTTDMTAAVTNACAQAVIAGGAPVQGLSTYLTTASIGNLHSAPKVPCPAIIMRGATPFYLYPSGSQTNVLNVAASGGNDANDGLGISQSLATWQAAHDAHQFYELPLSAGGNAVIQLGAGTWAAGCTFKAGFWTKNPIQLLGVAGSLPFTPTSILNNPASGNGVVGNGNNNVLIQDILFTNCNNAGSGFAMVFQGDSAGKLQIYHVYTSGCDNALKTQQMRLYVGQACWFEGGSGQAMVTSISNMTHTYGYNCSTTAAVGGANKGQAGVGLYMHGHTITGILVQECATGHFDYSCADNCAIGADITNASRLNCNFSAFGNNVTCARRLREGSNWNDNNTSVNDTGNGTANLLDGGCGEFAREGFWTIPRTQPVDLVFITNTGAIGSTVVKTYTNAIDFHSFNVKQQKFIVKVVGTTTGVVNTKNLTLNLDASPVSGFTLAAASTGDFIWTTTCNSNGSTAQSFDSIFEQNGILPQVQQASRSITPSAGTLTIAEIINGAGDTISIRAVYIWTEGGS